MEIIGFTLSQDDMEIPLTLSYDNVDIIFEFPINYQDSTSSFSSFILDLNSIF